MVALFHSNLRELDASKSKVKILKKAAGSKRICMMLAVCVSQRERRVVIDNDVDGDGGAACRLHACEKSLTG